jgi:hypothetical protein
MYICALNVILLGKHNIMILYEMNTNNSTKKGLTNIIALNL